jgi:hypothetical protein
MERERKCKYKKQEATKHSGFCQKNEEEKKKH